MLSPRPMTLDPSLDPHPDHRLDALARGWRGPLLAALVALIAGLPGLLALPVLDRDEARFAQSTAQMLETGNLIDTQFQDQSREREPIALHWLQAASVQVLSSAEARQIWAYRVPSLLGAMLAAAACAWGAAAFFGGGAGLLAGAMLGGCLILSTEAGIGKADALLCGAVTLALAALGRLYGANQAGARIERRTRLLFWLGLALAILDKGLVGLLTVGLTIGALWIWDRRAPWLRDLGWTWGLILLASILGPWLIAITVRTDGAAWTDTPAVDLAGVGPSGAAPAALHLLAAPLLLFPLAALLPAALVEGWKARREPGLRFALCWLAPNWLVLELEPTRLIHQALPLYGALAWLAAFALTRPLGAVTRWTGAALSLTAAIVLAGGQAYLSARLGNTPVEKLAALAAVLILAAGVSGCLILTRRWRLPALALTLGLGVAAHGAVAAIVAPRLNALWPSSAVVRGLDRAGVNPQRGLTPGPVAVAGFAEPSLVFALGTETELGDAGDAAEAISEGRPAVVEQRMDAAFRAALAAGRLKAHVIGAVAGLDYVSGAPVYLTLYRSDMPPPEDAAPPAPAPSPESAAPPSPAAKGQKPSGSRKKKP